MPQAHDLPTPDLYTPTATEPTTLTDPPAAHGAHGVSSEAAQQLALVIHDSFIRTTDFELSMNRIAMMFDAFAAQAVAAREAEIVAVLEHQAEVWERMKDMTPSAELRASVYRTAINYITK